MSFILVTGGAGFIGSHTCKALARSGFKPVVFDNLSTGHAEFVRWGDLINGDLHETDKLVGAITKYKPEAVVHFAASAYVGESVKNPLKYYKNNVGGTISLLEAMKSAGLSKLIFSSTCAVYGNPSRIPITEDMPTDPINPYGKSKLMVEQILQDVSSQNDFTYVALRYFNAAGSDPDFEIGEWHCPETHLIPLAIDAALGGDDLKVFGTDFNTPDGTAVRDFIHVQDLAAGHVSALKYILSGGKSAIVNLGTGKGTSVNEIISQLNDFGLEVNYSACERRTGDPAELIADNKKAKTLLGWSPEYSSLKSILSTSVTWRRHLKKMLHEK